MARLLETIEIFYAVNVNILLCKMMKCSVIRRQVNVVEFSGSPFPYMQPLSMFMQPHSAYSIFLIAPLMKF